MGSDDFGGLLYRTGSRVEEVLSRRVFLHVSATNLFTGQQDHECAGVKNIGWVADYINIARERVGHHRDELVERKHVGHRWLDSAGVFR